MTYFGDPWQHTPPSRPPRPGEQSWPPQPAPRTGGLPQGRPGQWHPQHQPYRTPGAYDPDLRPLRAAYRRLRRVSTLTALGCFAVFVVLSCYADDLMGTRVAGDLTLGVVLGLLQLLVTLAAIRWYERSARRSVDRLARDVREQISRQTGEAGAAR